ncbi:nitrogenase component 1 [Sporomusa sp. KB1]|jgi:nitrogenase molybdenum-iron protein alpha chain|uniref:nitrogenase component 1 n=1 Tax=Sporomusa sp. KB1 TaxID=943346 RepID=UPI0011A69AE9|nr:nitrogenase component 1 [Sporomusa sp. KB1]TWH47546.1 nitrogenase molybdenum-iron protein alpha chain [Sporomusa sp. KB1]
MSLLEDKVVPGRESRLEACIAYGGTACSLKGENKGCLKNQERAFSQSGLCQLLPTMGMLLTLPDTAVVVHGAIGCAANGISTVIGIRLRNVQKGNPNAKEGIWVSTNLTESDVVHGGEEKLEQTILETYERYSPKSIVVFQTCTPSIIGDDVASVIDRVRDKLAIPVLVAYCEGFKTKVWATGYDVAFHAIVHGFIESDKEGRPPRREPGSKRERPLVNVINLASVGKPDEDEITRLLNAIGIDVTIGPNFATRETIRNMTQADLTISVCPTHDDYFIDYLHKEYGVPYVLKDMPIGLENTRAWLLDIASHFGLENQAEAFIDAEEKKVLQAVAKYTPALSGKTVFLSAGEFRALVTGALFQELGLEVVGVRSYHHDHFGEDYYEKLVKNQNGKNFSVDIANFQPFELTNLLNKLKPDLFIGHVTDNIWAAKLGLPTVTIFRIFDSYIGYQGFYAVAKKAARVLKNFSFNQNLAKHTKNPYKLSWYEKNPFTFIKVQEAALASEQNTTETQKKKEVAAQ